MANTNGNAPENDTDDLFSDAEVFDFDDESKVYDLDTYEDVKRTIVTPGNYDAQVASAEVRTNDKKHERYLVVSFRITTPGDFEDVLVWRNLYFGEKAFRPFTLPVLKALLSGEERRNTLEGFAEALPDRFCRILIGTRLYEGEKFNDVKRVSPLDDEPSMPSEPPMRRPSRQGYRG